MSEKLNYQDGLVLFDLVNFVPTYFHFDFNNINLTLKANTKDPVNFSVTGFTM